MQVTILEKGQWYRMPLGGVAEVCRVTSAEVSLRYLDADGAMSPSDFEVTLEFMKKRTELVRVALPVAA